MDQYSGYNTFAPDQRPSRLRARDITDNVLSVAGTIASSYLSYKTTAAMFTKGGIKNFNIFGILKGPKGFGVAAAATILYTGIKSAIEVGKTITNYKQGLINMPGSVERALSFLSDINKIKFGGDTSALQFGATERMRAMQAIRTAHGTLNDQRFIGREARYYGAMGQGKLQR